MFEAASCALGFSAALIASAAAAEQREIRGIAFAQDGDDLVVNGTRVRLHGIDAFESGQTCTLDGATWQCGNNARRVLDELVASKEVRCELAQTSLSHGRPIMICYVGGMEINAELVRRGLAFDCTAFSKGRYKRVEAQAKAEQQGAWRGTFDWPWTWKEEDYCRRGRASPR